MYKLYWAKATGALLPQALFEEVGVAYEKIVIDREEEECQSEAFLSVNPMGQIPALILPDGTLMTESGAMLVYLADRHPGAGLAPRPESSARARFLRWVFFLSSALYPAMLRFYYSDRYSVDSGAGKGIQAAAAAEIDKQFSILEDALDPGPYLLGETFSAADIFLWMLIDWHPDPEQLFARAARLKELFARVHARPAIARIWPEHEEA
jgi:glutathione S-transferase